MSEKRDYIPVTDHKTLGRDPYSKGIVNTDVDAVYAARSRKEALNKKKQEEAQTQSRIADLEENVAEMKGMLQQILDKLK